MESSNKICVIGTYFGRFNNYFNLWLKSCQYNCKIDFYIFGDATYNGTLPENVEIVYMTLENVKRRAEEYLGFEVCLNTPYKCCDFKPIFGAIFRDYVSNYDYWGHCDFDLIFGDIFHCLEQNDYRNFDKFFNLGHLSFYRNTQAVFDYIKLDGSTVDYKKAFTSSDFFAFDEMECLAQIYLKNSLPFFTKRLFADIAEPDRYYRFKHSQYCYIEEKPRKNYRYQLFYWEHGKVYCAYFVGNELKVEELCYIHFKRRPNFDVHFDSEIIEAFYITPKGFVERGGEQITKELIEELNPINKVPFYEYFEYLSWQVKRQLKKVFRKLK